VPWLRAGTGLGSALIPIFDAYEVGPKDAPVSNVTTVCLDKWSLVLFIYVLFFGREHHGFNPYSLCRFASAEEATVRTESGLNQFTTFANRYSLAGA
jgi:hypothetical protein